MPDQLVAEYISTIYKYRGLLPFDNSESLSRRDIANWSDEALAKYFVYVLRREQNICKILEESKQKYLYLSEPYNDFIFSVLAEELGFVGCLLVFVLFAFFIWRGVLIAMRAPDMFGSLVAIGITALVGVQVIINVAVVTSSMPVTGMQLPFFSYGGTALFLLLCEMGVLLSISRASSKQ